MTAAIPNAELIRAVLDGKTVQHMTGMCPWYDMDQRTAILQLVEEPSESYRIKPDPVVKWMTVGRIGPMGSHIYVHCHTSKEAATSAPLDGCVKLLRLELDPDTLEVISARTEAA